MLNLISLPEMNSLEHLNVSVAEQLQQAADASIEAKSQAVYNYIIELCQKASQNGAYELCLKATDDTLILFKHPVVRRNVFKRLKNEGLKIKYVNKMLAQKFYIIVRWAA